MRNRRCGKEIWQASGRRKNVFFENYAYYRRLLESAARGEMQA